MLRYGKQRRYMESGDSKCLFTASWGHAVSIKRFNSDKKNSNGERAIDV